MKTSVKIICMGAVLAGMQVTYAAAPTTTPSPKSSGKQPMVSNVVHDRAPVETRMEYNSTLVKKRNAIAKKNAKPQPPRK